MLPVQVAFWTLVETNRHNLVTEHETQRHNMEIEAYNSAYLRETVRHNMRTEEETKRHNIATESWNNAMLSESIRHNKMNEKLGMINANIAKYNAETQRYNAITQRMKVNYDYDLGLRHNLVETKNAATNALNAFTAQKQANTQQYLAELKSFETRSTVAQNWARTSNDTQRVSIAQSEFNLTGQKFEWQKKTDIVDLGTKVVNAYSNLKKSSKSIGEQNRAALNSVKDVVKFSSALGY